METITEKNLRGQSPAAVDSVTAFSDRHCLSARQRSVLKGLVAGAAPKEIADQLGIAEATVRFHAVQLYRRCGVRNQREILALFARAACSDEPEAHRDSEPFLTPTRGQTI